MPLKPQKPYQLIGTFNRLVGWLQISELPNAVRAELLLHVSRCIAILAGVSHGTEKEESQEEASPESGRQIIEENDPFRTKKAT